MTSFYRKLSPMALGAVRLLEPSLPCRSAMGSTAEHDEDVELVRRALDGDERAIESLVERFQCIPRILGVFNQRIGNTLDAGELADLVQEVTALFWGRMADYSGKASLETWAYGFCLNAFMAYLRRRKTRSHERLDEDGQPDQRTVEVFADEYDCLHRSLGQLDPAEERVIRLKYFHDQTFEQIGADLRLSPNTVKTRFYRGMKRLEQLLRRTRRSE